MKCLIIAAGRGTRLGQEGNSKPIIPLLGIPIIERIIRTAIAAGINDFCVVSGYNGAKFREFFDTLIEKHSITITHITNEYWEKGNGRRLI